MMIEAVFVGQDRSLGYRYLKRYRLKVDGNTVRDIEGEGLSCPYSTIEAFMRNWQEVRSLKEVAAERPLKLKGLLGGA